MGRARTIRPEFFKHERVATLPALHRLLFIALWTQADRSGRIEDRPMRLKVECLPYDDCDVDAMIDDLEQHPDRLVRRYESDGRHFIEIPAFARHQNIHPREPESELPGFAEESMHEPCMTHASSMHARGTREKSTRVGEEKSRSSKTARKGKIAATPALFDLFYAEYPRKKARPLALRAWQRNVTLDIVPEVMTALRRQIADEPDWKRENGRYIPYPASWLNAEGWKNEIGVSGVATESAPLHKNDAFELAYLEKRSAGQLRASGGDE